MWLRQKLSKSEKTLSPRGPLLNWQEPAPSHKDARGAWGPGWPGLSVHTKGSLLRATRPFQEDTLLTTGARAPVRQVDTAALVSLLKVGQEKILNREPTPAYRHWSARVFSLVSFVAELLLQERKLKARNIP